MGRLSPGYPHARLVRPAPRATRACSSVRPAGHRDDALRRCALAPEDLALARRHRRSHNRLGFAVQLALVRDLGRPLRLDETLPDTVVDAVADQLGVEPAVFELYARRDGTRREHVGEIAALLNRNLPVLDGRECAGEAEFGDLAGEAVGLNLRRGAAEVVGAEVLVESAVTEHVISGGQDRGGDGADGLLGSAAVTQALELGLQIAGLFASPGPGALQQGGLEPGRALAQPGGASFAYALVVAWA